MYIVNLLESRNTRSIFIWCLPYFWFDYRSADWKALELSIHRRSRLLFHPEFCRIIFSYLNSGMIYVISFSYENRWRQNSDRKTRWLYLISPTSVRSQIHNRWTGISNVLKSPRSFHIFCIECHLLLVFNH